VKRWLPALVILAILFVPGFILPRFGADAVTASVAVQPEVLFELELGSFTLPVSNTLLTTWIVTILILLFAFFATRKMELVPSGLQNVMELIVEMWDGLGQSVAGARGRKFLPIVLTIFIFVLFSNWLGLVPGFGPVGYIVVDEKHPAPEGIVTFDLPHAWEEFLGPKASGEHGTSEHAGVLAPFVRSPSTDINTTLALALISVIMTQIFGMQALGVVKYWFARFLMIGKFIEFFKTLFKGKPNFGLLVFGFLDLFMGILEFISEVSKILSFTFRLFGNIFAGEVVLLIMAFLFFALPFPFYALEIFVGFIQAFVFAILTLVFMTIATTAHGAEEHH
jgi:F-type H+-transporting ATPase subunit a